MIGACLTCLIQTGALTRDVGYAFASETSGQSLLFSNAQTDPDGFSKAKPPSVKNVPVPLDIVLDPIKELES